jgi:hypothetical protein
VKVYDFSGQIRKIEAGNVSMKSEADEAAVDSSKDVRTSRGGGGEGVLLCG